MKDAKIITICGSLKFKDKIMEEAERLELSDNCVITPIIPTNEDKDAYSEAEVEVLNRIHKQKVKMADAIFVVNVNGYIGESTKSEIDYAKSLGKEIMYLEDIN